MRCKPHKFFWDTLYMYEYNTFDNLRFMEENLIIVIEIEVLEITEYLSIEIRDKTCLM